MPMKPNRPCTYPGCPLYAEPNSSRCKEHKHKAAKEYDQKRGNSGERGYDATWQKVRNIKANQDPLCEICLKQGMVKPLDVVHHIKPVETHPELRLVMSNLMSLCTACHEEIHKGERWGR